MEFNEFIITTVKIILISFVMGIAIKIINIIADHEFKF